MTKAEREQEAFSRRFNAPSYQSGKDVARQTQLHNAELEAEEKTFNYPELTNHDQKTFGQQNPLSTQKEEKAKESLTGVVKAAVVKAKTKEAFQENAKYAREKEIARAKHKAASEHEAREAKAAAEREAKETKARGTSAAKEAAALANAKSAAAAKKAQEEESRLAAQEEAQEVIRNLNNSGNLRIVNFPHNPPEIQERAITPQSVTQAPTSRPTTPEKETAAPAKPAPKKLDIAARYPAAAATQAAETVKPKETISTGVSVKDRMKAFQKGGNSPTL